jgi:hypothetical protein
VLKIECGQLFLVNEEYLHAKVIGWFLLREFASMTDFAVTYLVEAMVKQVIFRG